MNCITGNRPWLAELTDHLAASDAALTPRPLIPGHLLNLLNYMSAAKPVVCFSGAAKGIRHLRDVIVVADHDWTSVGHEITRLLRIGVRAKELAERARCAIVNGFGWQKLCPDLEQAYKTVTDIATTRSSAVRA
jgi:hypothetical protein